MALGDIGSQLKRIYDRLIAGVVLIGLLASLAYLGWHVGTELTAQEDFIAEINSIHPSHPEAQPVDVAPFEAALRSVRQPNQIATGADAPRMWGPGTRVQCIDCRRPIPYEAETCPFCRAAQPIDPTEDPNRDLDRDQIKDEWELAYGLNPNDPADADKDSDGDGFSNIEEFLASPSTDPTDPNDSPSIVMKLCLQSLEADPFDLLFKSIIRLPGGDKQFAINTRGNARTYFKRLGDDVEGFEVYKFEPKVRQIERFGRTINMDVSVLTLKRGDKEIPLTKGKGEAYTEYVCTLLFKVDDSTYELRLNDEFDLQGKRYALIEIDTTKRRVVIKRLLDGVELQVRTCADSDDVAGDKPMATSSPFGKE